MSRGRSAFPFYDEASRRQWESSIGIIHNTPKESMTSRAGGRLYMNPLKERAEQQRPVSPLLNLDEDRINLDEYADVAGHFFSDVMPVTVPSRSGKRPNNKKQKESQSNNKNIVSC